MERLLPREGSSISDDRGCGSLAGGASPSSRLSTKTTWDQHLRRVDAQRAWIYAGDSGALEPNGSEGSCAGANRSNHDLGRSHRPGHRRALPLLKVWGDGVVCQWLTRHLP